MVQFLRIGVVVVATFFILSLTMAIFSPIVENVLSDLVDRAIYDNQQKSLDLGSPHGDVSMYYHSLYSAKILIVNMFRLMPYTVSVLLLAYMILAPMRREESDVYV